MSGAEELKKLLDDIVALESNDAVYETWCGECNGVIPGMPQDGVEALGKCECKVPCRIFVGHDHECWEALGELEEMIKRAKPLLADLLGTMVKK